VILQAQPRLPRLTNQIGSASRACHPANESHPLPAHLFTYLTICTISTHGVPAIHAKFQHLTQVSSCIPRRVRTLEHPRHALPSAPQLTSCSTSVLDSENGRARISLERPIARSRKRRNSSCDRFKCPTFRREQAGQCFKCWKQEQSCYTTSPAEKDQQSAE